MSWHEGKSDTLPAGAHLARRRVVSEDNPDGADPESRDGSLARTDRSQIFERRRLGFRDDSVAQIEGAAGICGDAFAGENNPDQIQRIGGGDADHFSGRFGWEREARSESAATGKRELLAEETVDESAAANFAAIFEAAQRDENFAPR